VVSRITSVAQGRAQPIAADRSQRWL